MKRSTDSKDRFVIQGKFMPFLRRFPRNVAVFYDVDLIDKAAEPAGWLYLEEIKANLVEEDGWQVIKRPLLRPVTCIPVGM